MNDCTNLYFLSTLACRLAECMDEEALGLLSADLVTLGDLLASILVRKAACDETKGCFPQTEEGAQIP